MIDNNYSMISYQDQYKEQLNFEYKYIKEIEEMQPNLNLDTSELKETIMNIPFLNTTVIMYWEKDMFFYCSNKDLIYKYLNVVCRKFIIENNAKQLYLDGSYKNSQVSSSLFIKQETNLNSNYLEKINKFIRLETIDYFHKIKKNN
jgi:hypothetical protein